MNYPAASSGVATISNRYFLAASCGELNPKEIKYLLFFKEILVHNSKAMIYIFAILIKTTLGVNLFFHEAATIVKLSHFST